MRKLFSLVALATLFIMPAHAQLPDGSIAPNFTSTDINGVEHDLYTYLDNGYTVILDVSATWCGPCWNYHTSGILEEIWESHGPAGMAGVSESTTDDVMVFMIEGDASTTMDDLNGSGSSTIGNWITGTMYPIIDDASISDAYAINYYPTMYTICENRVLQESGQISAEAHYAIANVCAQESLAYQAYDTTPTVQDGGSVNTFTFNIVSGVETFLATLSTDAPADWSADLSAGAISDPVSVEVDALEGVENLVSVNVVPGATPALANYTVSLTSVDNPDNTPLILDYIVVSGITDLVVDHEGVATMMNVDFTNGLDLANNTSYGVMKSSKFIEAISDEQLSEVGHIYYNMAWNFPSFTDELVGALASFLDAGGNMYISGQDIGWDTWTPASGSGNGTETTQAFYTDYLSADYLDDGSGANNQLTNTVELGMFSVTGNSSINDIHNGNIYPDELGPLGNATAIYNYNNNESKVGGIRVEENGHKIVYMGIDQGMIADVEVRNQVIQISHDWFHGIISGIEVEEAYANIFGQNYPNPAVDYTIIPMNDLTEDVNLLLMDATGKVVFTDVVNQGSTNYRLDLSDFNSGLYHYVITNAKGQQMAAPIEIVK